VTATPPLSLSFLQRFESRLACILLRAYETWMQDRFAIESNICRRKSAGQLLQRRHASVEESWADGWLTVALVWGFQNFTSIVLGNP